eukprot:SAG11_NODE_909_length_6586_cov_11.216433_2_plen_75_part_00
MTWYMTHLAPSADIGGGQAQNARARDGGGGGGSSGAGSGGSAAVRLVFSGHLLVQNFVIVRSHKVTVVHAEGRG